MKKLTVVFIIRSTVYFMNTRSMIEAFLARGHRLEVLFGKSAEAWTKGAYLAPIKEFEARHPGFRYGEAYYQRTDRWRRLLVPLRLLLSYRRFLTVPGQSTYFRDRLVKTMPAILRPFFTIPGVRSFTRAVLKSNCAGALLDWIERRAPLDVCMADQLRAHRPDAVVLTLGGRRYGSFDVDYLNAARSLGIPTAVLVLTWDSLSSKAFLNVHPDLLLAWNDIHAAEAWEHHGIPRARTVVIGAPVFDSWFTHRTPSLSRAAFCARHGLDPADPFLLYLGSPASITHDERWLIQAVREALNVSHPRVQLVFRPHPAHSKLYAGMAIPGVRMVPRAGEFPDGAASLQLFYDTLHYAVGAAGVNTSAMIEAVIADKPVIALLRDEYAKTQSEAIHFKHLRDHGVLELAHSLEAFSAIVHDLIAGSGGHRGERKQFVRKLIRPRGLAHAAGAAAVDEIERLAERDAFHA